MKKKQMKKRLGKIYTAMALLIIIITAVILLSGQADNTSLDDSEILGRLQSFPELAPFTGYDSKVTRLKESDLKSLGSDEPVIYAGLDGKNIYRIEYTSQQDGYLVIYDAEKGAIERQFRILNMNLGR